MALLQLLVSPTANGGHMYNYRYTLSMMHGKSLLCTCA